MFESPCPDQISSARIAQIYICEMASAMTARIFKPAKTAMQSGFARTKAWVLEFEPEGGLVVEPLMGWTSSDDTGRQVRLHFDSKDEAIAYATRAGLAFQVFEPKARKPVQKSYANNFKFGRIGRWTH